MYFIGCQLKEQGDSYACCIMMPDTRAFLSESTPPPSLCIWLQRMRGVFWKRRDVASIAGLSRCTVSDDKCNHANKYVCFIVMLGARMSVPPTADFPPRPAPPVPHRKSAKSFHAVMRMRGSTRKVRKSASKAVLSRRQPRDTRLYGLNTAAMHDVGNEYPPTASPQANAQQA